MPWWKIIAILVVVALVVGAVIGVLGSLLGFSTTWVGVGAGAALGVVAATLLNRRRNQTPGS
jgi:drug/metabolite transporter (DMT)-like permease